MLHIKQLNSKKTRFPRFDKILVIQPTAEVYGEGNERQLCKEIGKSDGLIDGEVLNALRYISSIAAAIFYPSYFNLNFAQNSFQATGCFPK